MHRSHRIKLTLADLEAIETAVARDPDTQRALSVACPEREPRVFQARVDNAVRLYCARLAQEVSNVQE